MQRLARSLGIVAMGLAIIGGWQLLSNGQQSATDKAKTPDSNRLEFEVVQSFDAKYDGDSPGHLGRAGGLQNRRLHAALGDTIYRGDVKVGTVTGLTWNRTNGSLDIEFDPAENTRISVGDEVWMFLDGNAAASTTERGK
jgi:hypothetical protein